MSNNKKSGAGLFGKGYYIALILCAVAIGITGYVYYQNTREVPAAVQDAQDTQPDAALAASDPQADVPVIATQPSQSEKPTQGVKPQPSLPTPTEPAAKKPLQTMAPVKGDAVMEYSMEALSYNQTTRDWRVHNGMDLAAEEGTPVCAAADGTVYTIYEDDSMGVTVVIRHEGGYNTRYSSLSEEVAVKVGDQVAMGQTIGTVGTTALVETVLGPHVHFSVTWQDEPMDPQEFLALK